MLADPPPAPSLTGLAEAEWKRNAARIAAGRRACGPGMSSSLAAFFNLVEQRSSPMRDIEHQFGVRYASLTAIIGVLEGRSYGPAFGKQALDKGMLTRFAPAVNGSFGTVRSSRLCSFSVPLASVWLA